MVVHDENSLDAQDSSHLSSSCMLHEDNSSSQLAKFFHEACDKDGCHLVGSGLIENGSSSYPHTMHDLVQSSKCDFTIMEIYWNCQGVEALQLSLMVM